MPRNCGCSGQCSCVLREGTGITIEGAGRPENPFIISAEGGGGGGGAFDTGDLKWTALPAAPSGWLVCDGAAVSRSIYADLFAAIGTTYGSGDGDTTFTLPDFTGRFMLGADGTHPHGVSGGTEQHVLSAQQMPVHSHSINHDHPAVNTTSNGAHEHNAGTSTSPGGSQFYAARGGAGTLVRNAGLIDVAGAHVHSVNVPTYAGTSGGAGGGQPFSTMPPYGTALPLIKT